MLKDYNAVCYKCKLHYSTVGMYQAHHVIGSKLSSSESFFKY